MMSLPAVSLDVAETSCDKDCASSRAEEKMTADGLHQVQVKQECTEDFVNAAIKSEPMDSHSIDSHTPSSSSCCDNTPIIKGDTTTPDINKTVTYENPASHETPASHNTPVSVSLDFHPAFRDQSLGHVTETLGHMTDLLKAKDKLKSRLSSQNPPNLSLANSSHVVHVLGTVNKRKQSEQHSESDSKKMKLKSPEHFDNTKIVDRTLPNTDRNLLNIKQTISNLDQTFPNTDRTLPNTNRNFPNLGSPSQGQGPSYPVLENMLRKPIDRLIEDIDVLHKPTDRHIAFFKSILPSLHKLEDDETLQFQAEVLATLSGISNARAGGLKQSTATVPLGVSELPFVRVGVVGGSATVTKNNDQEKKCLKVINAHTWVPDLLD